MIALVIPLPLVTNFSPIINLPIAANGLPLTMDIKIILHWIYQHPLLEVWS